LALAKLTSPRAIVSSTRTLRRAALPIVVPW
jgi:hypothetical protein